jgi:hypothetical protein
METSDSEIWRYGDIGDMEIWRYGDMETSTSHGLVVTQLGGIHDIDGSGYVLE